MKLFKQRLRDFLSKHWQEERVSSIIRKLEERLGKRIDLEEAVKVFEDWIDWGGWNSFSRIGN